MCYNVSHSIALSDKIEEKEKQIKELETFEEKYKHLTEEHTTLK